MDADELACDAAAALAGFHLHQPADAAGASRWSAKEPGVVARVVARMWDMVEDVPHTTEGIIAAALTAESP